MALLEHLQEISEVTLLTREEVGDSRRCTIVGSSSEKLQAGKGNRTGGEGKKCVHLLA